MKHKTIPRWALIAIALFVIGALMTGVALARTGGAMFSAGGNSSNVANQPDAIILNGGHYQLTSITVSYVQDDTVQDNKIASGGGYHLQTVDSPRLTGSGCCCLYAPCILR